MKPLDQLKKWLEVGLPDPSQFNDVLLQCSEYEKAEFEVYLDQHLKIHGSGFGSLDPVLWTCSDATQARLHKGSYAATVAIQYLVENPEVRSVAIQEHRYNGFDGYTPTGKTVLLAVPNASHLKDEDE